MISLIKINVFRYLQIFQIQINDLKIFSIQDVKTVVFLKINLYNAYSLDIITFMIVSDKLKKHA